MKILILAGGLAISAIATAQTGPQTLDRPGTKSGDRVICRNMGEIGSRLSRNRVCKTAAEWAEDARRERDNIRSRDTRTVTS